MNKVSTLATAAELTAAVEVRPVGVPADGFWAALCAADDGAVYIGTCKHGGSAYLLRYDPGPDRITSLGAVADAVRERWSGCQPQAKIHVHFQPAGGCLYFASHMGNFWYHTRENERTAFPGSHWLRYDLASGAIADLGHAVRRQGVISMVMDPARGILYGMTFPRGHLLRYDIASAATRDLGRIANWDSICRSLVLDDAGNLYGALRPNRIFRYHPDADTVELLPCPLPHRDSMAHRPRGSTTSDAIWRIAFYHPGRRRIYAIHAGTVELFEYSPETGESRMLTPMCPDEFIGADAVPYASMALARDSRDVLYYGAQGGASRFDYSATEGAGAEGPRTHLVTYDLRTGLRRDHGQMAALTGEHVLGVEGAAIDAAGNLYFAGLVQKPGDAPRIALIIYREGSNPR